MFVVSGRFPGSLDNRINCSKYSRFVNSGIVLATTYLGCI